MSFSFLDFIKEENGSSAYFTSLYMISSRYIQPKCSDFDGIQGVTRAGTKSKGRSWDLGGRGWY
jgi:hypothetical protein